MERVWLQSVRNIVPVHEHLDVVVNCHRHVHARDTHRHSEVMSRQKIGSQWPARLGVPIEGTIRQARLTKRSSARRPGGVVEPGLLKAATLVITYDLILVAGGVIR